jgi:hypothetical protein
MKSYMQVIFRGIDWCRQWPMLQRCEEGTELLVKETCLTLKTTIMQIFVKLGWTFSNRLAVLTTLS